MGLKLFTPQEAKSANSAQNTRDVLRTREIKKMMEKSHTELAKYEADFSAMIARHKEKWAQEEQNHAIRTAEMGQEVRALEERRKDALIPIEIEKQKADTMIDEATKRLGEVEKKERDNDELKDVLMQRIEDVSERESAVKDEEEKILEMRRGVELERATNTANTKALSEAIEKFNMYVSSETTALDHKRTEITLRERSIEARREALGRKEKSLATRETQIKDKQETLTRAFDEFRKNKMENTENTAVETPVEAIPEVASEATESTPEAPAETGLAQGETE